MFRCNWPDGANAPSVTFEALTQSTSPLKRVRLFSYIVDWEWILNILPPNLEHLFFCVNWVPETQNSENPLPKRWKEGTREMEYLGRHFVVHHPVLAGGLQHAKLLLFEFDDYLRVVVTSANLTLDDWSNLGQIFWFFDAPRRNTSGGNVASPFSEDLKVTLNWLQVDAGFVDGFDFSGTDCRLILSAPCQILALAAQPDGDDDDDEESRAFHGGLTTEQKNHFRSLSAKPLGLDGLSEVLGRPSAGGMPPCGQGIIYQASSVGGITDQLLRRFTDSAFGSGSAAILWPKINEALHVPFPSMDSVTTQLEQGRVGAITLRLFQSAGSTLSKKCLHDWPSSVPFHSKVLTHTCGDANCSFRFTCAGSHNFTSDSWCSGRNAQRSDPRNFELSVVATGKTADLSGVMPASFFQTVHSINYQPFVYLRHKRRVLEIGSKSRGAASISKFGNKHLDYHWEKFQEEVDDDFGRH